MADTRAHPWTNFFGQMKVASISILNYFSQPPPPPTSSPSPDSLLGFIVTVLLSFLQLKYQGKEKYPFETHPKTIFVSFGSLLLYCCGYDAKFRWPIFASVVSDLMVVFGSLSLVSLASILFPDSFGPVLYFFYSLFFAAEFLKLLIWVYRKIVGIFFSQLASHAFPYTGDLSTV